MEFVDTHCHIQSAGLKVGERSTRELWAKSDGLTPDLLVKDAKKNGVKTIICVGCDLEDSQLAIDCAKDRNGLYASIGLHPHEAQHYARESAKLEEFTALVGQPKVVAIGECGLDYYYTHSPKEDQLKVLEFQLKLAVEYQLPLIFHVREAFADFWPLFDKYHNVSRPVRGVLHSYTDSQANLEKAVERGLYIGVNGIATFAKDPAQLEVYKQVPKQHLLLETDAPFLTPAPYRGTINEPKQVRTIADFVANLREEDVSHLAAATTANARRLFQV